MKRNLKKKYSPNKTPQRKSPRKVALGMVKKNSVKRLKKMKTLTYESPLKYLYTKRCKQQLIRDHSSPIQSMKSQKPSRRESVIIINEDKMEANESVIILEDDVNQETSVDLNQTEDVEVVWSSVPGSPRQKNQCQTQNLNSGSTLPFNVDVTPNKKNLDMLRGDSSRIWLNNYRETHQMNLRKKENNKKPPYKRRNRIEKRQKENEKSEKTETCKKQQRKAPGETPSVKLRKIVIDGCNVAKEHSKGEFFSVDGLKIVIDYFQSRGHDVKAFVPQYERRKDRPSLEEFNKQGIVVFTPSRKIRGKSITPYDDRYILEYAAQCGGIVVSNDQFRDLYEEKPEWREVIENRILPPTFVENLLMFPEDPLGRHGPTLDEFLRHET